MDWFNQIFDLAAVASGAGLAGGAGSTAIALAFSGAIVRFIMRTLLTALLTGVGFVFLLDWLGFEIVASEELAARAPIEDGRFGAESFTGPDGQPVERAEIPKGERVYVINSPFRKD